MAEVFVIQRPIAPSVTHYLEYQDVNRPLRAYLFPCTETGEAIKDKINNKELFLTISSDLLNYTYLGIKKLESNSQRLLLACNCGYVFFFDSWDTEEDICPNCHRGWAVSTLLS